MCVYSEQQFEKKDGEENPQLKRNKKFHLVNLYSKVMNTNEWRIILNQVVGLLGS